MPRPNSPHVNFILSLDNAMRQGQTSYPFVVMQFDSENVTSVEVNLEEAELKERGLEKQLEGRWLGTGAFLICILLMLRSLDLVLFAACCACVLVCLLMCATVVAAAAVVLAVTFVAVVLFLSFVLLLFSSLFAGFLPSYMISHSAFSINNSLCRWMPMRLLR